MRRWLIALGLCLAATAGAAAPATVSVTSEPVGAEVVVGNVVLGVTPLDLSAETGETLALVVRMRGRQSAEQSIDVAGPDISLHLDLPPARGRITVTTASDLDVAYDGRVSLREALLFARGERAPRGADRAYVSGDVGAGHGDDIVFAAETFAGARYLFLGSALPPLDDDGDHLIGPGRQLTMMPAERAVIAGAGLTMGPGTAVTGLSLDGFDTGVAARGFGEVDIAEVTVLSAMVGIDAGEGAHAILDEVAVAAVLAPRLATGGGIVEGQVTERDIGDPEALTLVLDPPGERAKLRFTGWQGLTGRPYLYVREDALKPIHQVPELAAESSSYTYFDILGFGVSDQAWAIYALDGNPDSLFQWSFSGDGYRETWEMTLHRPLRTDSITIHHWPDEANRLVRYRFQLYDHIWNILFETEVETDGISDTFAVDPELDFFAMQITVLEAIGKTPAIREIEAEVLDSVAYEPLSHSPWQIVYPRPDHGSRAAFEHNRTLHVLGTSAFEDGTRAAMPGQMLRATPQPSLHLYVDTEEDVVADDDQLSLREAILFLNGTHELTAAEAELVEGEPGWSATIELLVDRIALREPLPTIRYPEIRLLGEGTRLEGQPHLLAFEDCARAAVSGLSLAGSIGTERVGTLTVTDTVMSDFGNVAIYAGNTRTLVARSRFERGETAITTEAELHVVESRFEALATAILPARQQATVLFSNRFQDVPVPLQLERGGEGAETIIAVGNHAEGTLAPVAMPTGDDDRWARERPGMLLANTPARLGLPPEIFSLERATFSGVGVIDLREGQGQAALRHMEFDSQDGRCFVERAGKRHRLIGLAFFALLYDTPVDVVCVGRNSADRRHLLPPGGEDLVALGDSVALSHISASDHPEPLLQRSELDGFPLALRNTPFGDGLAVPDRRPGRRSEALGQLVAAMVKAGNPQAAVAAALAAHERLPGNAGIVDTVFYAAERWARQLEEGGAFDDAGDLLSDMRDRLGGGAEADEVYLAHLHRYAAASIAASAWTKAIDLYDAVLAEDAGDEVAAQNLVYTYHQWAIARVALEPPDTLVRWLDDAAAARPTMATDLSEIADDIVLRALGAAMDGGHYEHAFDTAGLAFARAETEDSRNTLVYTFQEWVRAGDVDQAFAALAVAHERHPDIGDFDEVLNIAVGNRIAALIDSGDAAVALVVAESLLVASDDPRFHDIYVYAAMRNAEQVRTQSGFDTAMSVIEAAILSHPALLGLRQNAAGLANDQAVAHSNDGNPAEAVATFRRGLAFDPQSELLLDNLFITYVNWAVDLVNNGSHAEGLRVTEEALGLYPGDAKLTEIRDFARQRL
jgi:tetratricopeptide (TPR) repeat protein